MNSSPVETLAAMLNGKKVSLPLLTELYDFLWDYKSDKEFAVDLLNFIIGVLSERKISIYKQM